MIISSNGLTIFLICCRWVYDKNQDVMSPIENNLRFVVIGIFITILYFFDYTFRLSVTK